MTQKEQLHTIQQLSAKLNIPKPTLRFWEKEFEGILQTFSFYIPYADNCNR